jgi:hypothetical protein
MPMKSREASQFASDKPKGFMCGFVLQVRIGAMLLRAAIAVLIALPLVLMPTFSPGQETNCRRTNCPKGDTDMDATATGQPAPMRSMRLIFEYDGDKIKLVGQQPVDMAVTGFDITQTQHPGFFVDTRDADGRMLTRVPAREAFSSSMEVFPEKHGDPIERINVKKPKGAFTVIVPAPEAADHFSVVEVTAPKAGVATSTSRATSDEEGSAEVKELARFPVQPSAGKGEKP